MQEKSMQAALQFLKDTGQFSETQCQAIAQAIRVALEKFEFSAVLTLPKQLPPHSHEVENFEGHTHKITA